MFAKSPVIRVPQALMLFCLAGVFAAPSPLVSWAPPDSSGVVAIRNGNFADALETVLRDTTFADSAFRYFKLGLAHAGLNNFGKALLYLKLSARNDTVWAPFAYEKIGDIELGQGRWKNAIQAYRAALDGVHKQRYQQYLYGKMYRIVTNYADSIGDVAWIEECAGPPPQGVEVDLMDRFERMLQEQSWAELDSAVENLLDTSQYNQLHCRVAARLIQEPVPDSVLCTRALFKLSRIASTCGNYTASSDWLLEALSRNDFEKVINDKAYLYHRAELNFKLKNYNKSIRWLKKYEKKYGLLPEIAYMLARCYRSLGKSDHSISWYTKFIDTFPTHSMTPDILWYLAREKENEGDSRGARELYRRIMQTYASRSTADDSYFRYALSFYRDGQYDSAGIWFSMFTKEYPGSSMLTAAQYWHAKSLLALGDSAAAADRFREVADSYPIEYYGFNARGICASLCKNPPSFAIDTVNDPAAAVEWLDSVSKLVEKALGPGDSLSLTVGLSCAALGMHEHADFFLEPLEICYERNLSLQYLLAQVYKESGDLARSFGIVRRFAWTVPRQDRLSMPLALYTLLYPFGFDSLVGRFCDEFKVEPELIYAIMRQESIFDPVIVSPVGAIGLMQIMPFTGEQIARELNDTYDTDSLYNPAVNVRYGVYYIGSLIKEFEGDMVCAVAGFNGGPHNVKKWLETKKSDDQDLFVEDIGFSETRNYVKKVLANYWLYKKLAQVRKPVQD